MAAISAQVLTVWDSTTLARFLLGVDSGMNTAMDQICAQYDDKDLQLLAGFLHRTAEAARTAAERLAAS